MESTRTALVLGATGGIGGEVARNLKRRGWHVRAMTRDPRRNAGRDGLEWVGGDAMVAQDVARAAAGAGLLVHAVNPPGYRDWERQVLPMLDSTLAAARASRARILFPGTIYNFGPDAWPVLAEGAPQHPLTSKGRIRVEMEQRLRAAAGEGVSTTLVRAGDFFGPRAANSWFGQGMVTPGRPVTSIRYPGRRGIGHQWGYLPDVAEAMARLVERGPAAGFESFHMAGHWDPDGTAMVAAIRRAVGDPKLPVRGFPWWLARLGQPFVPVFRGIVEMRYLWANPLRMPNDRLVAALGSEPHTPLDAAVAATLVGLGCLPEAARSTTAQGVRA
ncbi:MAG: NAD(P)H-binding protein [Amaricoccus sp.]